jgi:hypothetical protein
MKYLIMMFGAPSTMLETHTREWIMEMIDFMHALNADLTRAGELVDAQGLADASQAKTVRLTDGIPVATDGPYAESKESLAGYWVVDVENEARAIEIASRVVAFIGPAGAAPLEIRQIMAGPPEV